jgi:hypothetical protein
MMRDEALEDIIMYASLYLEALIYPVVKFFFSNYLPVDVLLHKSTINEVYDFPGNKPSIQTLIRNSLRSEIR